ncbi:ECF transporter S component [Ktedonobacter robiniae]|uniref:ECF transporter S component n=3 Tax=Ktedonobacter TaxID=363276 RepID=D6TJP8_KTERA|nr:ECF transporter S component [Ktedonobacter robiniae]EFH89655.1 conserved hypothetical protein [Ktedonobacter racemifer DSM 44963]GHO54679.1 hypothetical protein KSB_31540 [Ktedonobacter robiniae]
MSKVEQKTQSMDPTHPWKLTTERIVIAAMLAGLTVCITLIPGIGFIPVPNVSGNATTGHIPTIIGGIVGGPIVGLLTGFIFGLMSLLHASSPLFKDPTVAILPRIFIGLTAWATFAALKRFSFDVAAISAGVIGSLTNSVLVISMGMIRGYIPANGVILASFLPQVIAEAIISAIFAEAVARSYAIVQQRLVHAPETKAREELPY